MLVRAVPLLLQLGALASWRLAAQQCPDGSPPPCRAQPVRTTPAPPPNSVAVLYFENLSPDTADAYLADGFTEEIIARLSTVARLEVTSRHAVRRYRGAPVTDPRAIGRSLNVAFLVSGTLRRTHARIHVTVELVRTGTGAQVWGDRMAGELPDPFVLVENVAREVATAVVGHLLQPERRAVAQRPTASPDAYHHFLRGNLYLGQRTPATFARAVREYDAALRLDSSFTRAGARLAYAHALALSWGWEVRGLRRDNILGRGLRLAADAIRRDPDNSDAWMARGYLLKLRNARTYDGVREAFRRAVGLDEGNAEAWHQYGSVLYDLGDDSASAAAFRRALAIEPDREITLLEASYLPQIAGRLDEALQLVDSAVAVAPASGNARLHRAALRLLMEDTAAARRDAEVVRQTGGDAEFIFARLAARSRDTLAVRGFRTWVVALADVDPGDDPSYVAGAVLPVLLDFGERERALRMLESLQPRGPRLWFWLRGPACDPLRLEPRFQRLLEESRPR